MQKSALGVYYLCIIRQCLYAVLCLIVTFPPFSVLQTQRNQIASLCQIKNLLEHLLFNKPRTYLPLAAFAAFALPLELYK